MNERLKKLWEQYRIYFIGAAAAMVVAAGFAVQAFEKPAPTLAEPLATESPVAEIIVIDVQGAVMVPGVHRLLAGSLVDDALAAAGGLMPEADLDRVAREINRADKLKGHQKIYVPFTIDRVLTAAPTGAASAGTTGSGSESSGELINLNTATAEELDTLPGVGPSTAQKIIDYREQNGGFRSVEDLNEVSGIGDVTFEKLKDLVTV